MAPVPAAPAAPAAPIMADIAHAKSGEVPPGTLKTPTGPLQIAVIQFGRASSGLGGNDLSVLSKVAQIQRRNGGTVRIVAHAAQDVSGSSVAAIENGNYEVSKRRALAIADRLMELGVPRSSIVAEAASDSEPIYETNTARGIAANRRAEVFLDF
jgi:outer membrane protein OmpA-like peptidoglycan-associated protein